MVRAHGFTCKAIACPGRDGLCRQCNQVALCKALKAGCSFQACEYGFLRTSFSLPLDTKVYAAMGNHDFHPKNQFPGKDHRIYNRTAELWHPWLSNASIPLFRAGLVPLTAVDSTLRGRGG